MRVLSQCKWALKVKLNRQKSVKSGIWITIYASGLVQKGIVSDQIPDFFSGCEVFTFPIVSISDFESEYVCFPISNPDFELVFQISNPDRVRKLSLIHI